MRYRTQITTIILSGLTAATLLAGCGISPTGSAAAQQSSSTATAIIAATSSTTLRPTVVAAAPVLRAGVSGVGDIVANQDADLNFQVQGTVAQVFIQEGDVVTKGQVLALLDTRPFDEKVAQAAAALRVTQAQRGGAVAQQSSAQAQLAGLSEAPKAAQVQAAQAQVEAAKIALEQARNGQTQDTRTADSAVVQAQQGLQSQRDQLSNAKTQAQLQMQQAADALTQAQAAYAQAKSNWEYVQSTGNDPVTPAVKDATGKSHDNEVSGGSRDNYYRAFVQAEASMQQAETAMEAARVAYETAQQAEATGVQTAEQQVVQAQASLDKLKLPENVDRVAAAQAQVKLAQANLAALKPAPGASQRAQAAAGIEQAASGVDQSDANIAQSEASLRQAQLNRDYAELHAPYDGVVSIVNIDPGDASSVSSGAALRILDVSTLRVEVPISDADIAQVKIGQTAQIHADAFNDTAFTGKVTYIAPEATIAGAIRTYMVRITLNQPRDLKPGMQAQVDIETP